MKRYYIVRIGTLGSFRWLDEHYNPIIICRENAHKFETYKYARMNANFWASGCVEVGIETREDTANGPAKI